MAKYLNKQKKRKKALVPVLLLVAVVAVGALVWFLRDDEEEVPVINLSQTTMPSESVDSEVQATEAAQAQEPQPESEEIILSEGLKILHIADYVGMYMEDGTNEVVSDVMMIVVENTSDKDLQLARISLVYPDLTANFEITNLPAGEKLVALERSRQGAPDQKPESAELTNVVFMDTPMTALEGEFRFSGSDGLLTVENISGADISEEIYIYYKYSSSDLLYGGITFRVVVPGGLAADEKTSLFTGHYSPDSCRIVSVAYGA